MLESSSPAVVGPGRHDTTRPCRSCSLEGRTGLCKATCMHHCWLMCHYAPGGAHEGCEDKEPATRLAGLEAAGRARVPFTTGGWEGRALARPANVPECATLMSALGFIV
jgi:hypothetical protein